MGSNKTEFAMAKDKININAIQGANTAAVELDGGSNAISGSAKDITLEAKDTMTLKAKTINISADQEIVMKANQQISMKVGPAEVQISTQEVVIKVGPVSLNINPTELEASAPMMSLEGQASVGIKGLSIDLEGASITA